MKLALKGGKASSKCDNKSYQMRVKKFIFMRYDGD